MLIDKKLHSCSAYTTQPCNPEGKTGLRALAAKVIRQTTQCNLDAKDGHNKLQAYQITQEQLKNFLGEDWLLYAENENALQAWSNMLRERKLMEAGQVPSDFTSKVYCESCQQYVLLPPGLAKHGLVYGCPWCLNKAKGLPIPKPNQERALS